MVASTICLLHEIKQVFKEVSTNESFPIFGDSCSNGKIRRLIRMLSLEYNYRYLNKVATVLYPNGIGQFLAGELSTHQQVCEFYEN